MCVCMTFNSMMKFLAFVVCACINDDEKKDRMEPHACTDKPKRAHTHKYTNTSTC